MLARPEESFAIWKLWRSMGGTSTFVPLWPGGVLDWPEWYVHDAAILNWLNRIARRDMGLDE